MCATAVYQLMIPRGRYGTSAGLRGVGAFLKKGDDEGTWKEIKGHLEGEIEEEINSHRSSKLLLLLL
jgi:hypothetical protein